jgi:hypothetical protein
VMKMVPHALSRNRFVYSPSWINSAHWRGARSGQSSSGQ